MLSDMNAGDSGKMSHLKSNDTDSVKKLLNMGFVPGRQLKLDTQGDGERPYIVVIGDSTVTLDSDLAHIVYVTV